MAKRNVLLTVLASVMLVTGLAACGSGGKSASTADRVESSTSSKAAGDTPTTTSSPSSSTAEFCTALARAMNAESPPVVITGEMSAEEAAALKQQAQAQAAPWETLAPAAPAEIRAQAQTVRDGLANVASLDANALETASRALSTDQGYLTAITEIIAWATANCAPGA